MFGFSGRPDPALEKAMAAALRHRFPGETVTHTHPAGTLAGDGADPGVGLPNMTGLAVAGDRALLLAGFLTRVPPGVVDIAGLLSVYERRGPAILDELNGAFVLAVRDGDTLHLARDATGQRTVYYGQHGGRFLFAIEPRGVLAAPGFPRRLRPGAVAQYLTFSFIPGSDTMLEGVHEVPAGHAVTFRGGRVTTDRYFRFEEEVRESRPRADWIEEFRALFRAALAARRPHREDASVFLSGGLDSSVVAAELARQSDRPVRTWSIHFGREYHHELDFAHAVARRIGARHTDVEIRPRDFLPRLERMVDALDEPIGDPITMPNFELATRAARESRFVFNGEGGDPLFGGPKNIPMMMHHWYGGIDRGPGFRERAYLASYRRAYTELEHLLTPSWRARYDRKAELEDVLTPFFETDRPTAFLDKLMAINIRLKGAHLILPKVERMTAAAGLTVLSPLFDADLVRLSFRMPPDLKLARGIEKVVIKEAYRHALPPEVIARPKSGMRVPVHFWFKGELKRYARRTLNRRSLAQAGIFEPDRVRRLLAYDTSEGPGRYGLRLWMLVTFELWRRRTFGDGPGTNMRTESNMGGDT